MWKFGLGVGRMGGVRLVHGGRCVSFLCQSKSNQSNAFDEFRLQSPRRRSDLETFVPIVFAFPAGPCRGGARRLRVYVCQVCAGARVYLEPVHVDAGKRPAYHPDECHPSYSVRLLLSTFWWSCTPISPYSSFVASCSRACPLLLALPAECHMCMMMGSCGRRYEILAFHFRSIDTWLGGVCRSFCPSHPWRLGFSKKRQSGSRDRQARDC